MAWPTITIGGVDRTSTVATAHPLTIDDTRSATPSTAQFTIDGRHGYVPPALATVTMVLGGRTLFGGQIVSIEQTWEGSPAHAVFRCSCTGWGRLLDAKTVSGRWTAHSATDLIADLVSGYTSGFTTSLEAAMATVDEITFTDATVSEAISAVMEQVGGRWYVDESKVIHAFTTVPEAGVEQPDTLTEANCRQITKRVEWGDVVTRQRVAGPSTTLLAPLAATDTIVPVAGFHARIPGTGRTVTDMRGFDAAGGCLRIDAIPPYTSCDATYTGVVDKGTAVGHAFAQLGANSVALQTGESGIFESGGGWAAVGSMLIRYTGTNASGLTGVPTPTAYVGITRSGHTADVEFSVAHGFTVGQWVTVVVGNNGVNVPVDSYAGTVQITAVPYTNHLQYYVEDDTVANTAVAGYVGPVGWITSAIAANTLIAPCKLLTGVSGLTDQEAGATVAAVAVVDDATAQAALAALDGSDGIRDGAVLTQGDLSAADLAGRGAAELAVRKNADTRLTYETTDPKTRAGTQVTASLYWRSYAAEVYADSPVAQWRLGELTGTSAADNTGNGHTGTYQSGTTLAAIGALRDGDCAVRVNGTTGYVTVPDHNALDLTSTFTLEAWVKWNTFKNYGAVLVKGSGGDPSFWNYGLWSLGNGNVYVYTGDGGFHADSHVVNLSAYLGQWVHLVATRASNTLRLYVNGVATDAGVSSSHTPVGTATALGLGGDAAGSYSLDGWLDEVAIYATALSATRIAAHYAAASRPPAITGTHLITRVTFSDFSANGAPRMRVETTDRRYAPVSLWKRLAR